MKVLDVYIEHAKASLDRTFTYLYDGKEDIGPGFRVIVKFGHQRLMGYVAKVTETELDKEEISRVNGFEINYIEGIVDKAPLLNPELLALAEEVSAHYLAPMISVLQAMLPQSLKPKSSALKGPKIAYEDYVELLDASEEGLTPKQIEMVRLLKENGTVLKKEVGSFAVLTKLVEKGRVRVFKQEKRRLVLKDYEERPKPHLTFAQQKALEDIYGSPKDVVLLQGVTGSGKTEVYLQLSERYLSEGKNILMLVPEISLTPVMVEFFSRRFKGEVAILHSQLTPAEKYDEYRRIASGKAKVVVGARSAVFAPLDNIGLIILDEEHVETYKQENLPYYHAREVAIMRAKHFGSKVLLGSATPSLETKARAGKGVYGYAELPKRINERNLPTTTIVDLRKPGALGNDHSHVFSKVLLEKLRGVLERKEQALLLINRRGYSSYLACSDCGHIFTCPNCGANLTYHRSDELLKCHHCDYVSHYPEDCPACHSRKLMRVGFGTERIAKILKEYFPEANVGRLDTDVTKVRANLSKVLEDFRSGKYDILVGTQMIAKGHDFSNVTLVGVVLADIGLSMPTFRAAERTFQLIAQAVGRSGRAEKSGEALIQTYNPTHYAITLGARQDYESFYRKEMETRKLTRYPPYVYLVCVEFSGKSEEKVVQTAFDFKTALLQKGLQGSAVLGPSTPFFAYVDGIYYRRLLLKHRNPEETFECLETLLKAFLGVSGVEIKLDVDPLDY